MDFDSVLKEQLQELRLIERQEEIVQREKSAEAEKLLRFPNILAILGIRRCGKSVFSYMLAKGKSFGYVNFDDERLLGVGVEDLNEILKSFYKLYGDIEVVVLDEVQNVKGWELFANRLRRTKKVILTGSNSRLLSGELATHLTGRHLDITLFPFSFREFIKLKKFSENNVYTTREQAQLLRLLEEYLRDGGFPEVQKFGRRIVSVIYEDIITKDILLRYKIKKIEELRKLAKYLITNYTSEFSYKKTAKTLSVKHVVTISKWTEYLERAFLVFRVERFDFKLRQQFLAPKKIYCIDSSLINAVGFGFSDDRGKLIENAVAVELKRRSDESTGVYYWKDYRQNEVDFVIKGANKVEQLIQVSYAGSMDEIKEREKESLLHAAKALKCRNLLVITWAFEGNEKMGKQTINYIPLWKWLLAKK